MPPKEVVGLSVPTLSIVQPRNELSMAKPGFGKRIRERKQEEERKKKDVKRAQRREARKDRPADFDSYPIVQREMPDLDS